jgi:Flp pilus assembly pilin Flp
MSYLAKVRARLADNSLVRDEAGLSTVEYVIILVLIAAVAIATWKTFGETVETKLEEANTEFEDKVKVQ